MRSFEEAKRKYKAEIIKLPTWAEIILIVLAAGLAGKRGGKVIQGAVKDYVKRYREQHPEIEKRELNEATLRVVLTRLRRGGFVKNDGWGVWNVTDKGESRVKSLFDSEDKIDKKEPRGNPDTIIIFDIPESIRSKRDYLRLKLSSLGFWSLQKSVWLGYSPLPVEFFKYCIAMGIISYIHIFSIKDKGSLPFGKF